MDSTIDINDQQTDRPYDSVACFHHNVKSLLSDSSVLNLRNYAMLVLYKSGWSESQVGIAFRLKRPERQIRNTRSRLLKHGVDVGELVNHGNPDLAEALEVLESQFLNENKPRTFRNFAIVRLKFAGFEMGDLASIFLANKGHLYRVIDDTMTQLRSIASEIDNPFTSHVSESSTVCCPHCSLEFDVSLSELWKNATPENAS